jgi:hypothetical protein
MLKGDIMLIYHTWARRRNLENITRLKEHAQLEIMMPGRYDVPKLKINYRLFLCCHSRF